MDAGSLLANLFALSEGSLPLILAATGLVLALIALISSRRISSRCQEDLEQTKQRLDTLWHEMDDLRVEQFNGSGRPTPESSPLDSDRLGVEKTAYDRLWPLVCDLHDKLGTFLRAAETGEAASDSRVQARNAALEARTVLNNVRPFCSAHVDDLASRLIDHEIKAHLAGCQYQDLRDETGNQAEGERERLHQKFRLLYDGDCRELMNQLIEAIRRRMIRGTEHLHR
ncbi:hypothetical protein [Marinobacter zhejiangensis]|uniref:Uncharacterized protein n=1 Tax=Marinobacter zhejiangensis TaxID=488535 RepID=A0A1I4QD23_9GAMM|nr:hypothetical protein [Marinobacter zhejiangensis]SFM37625.1 hypothetical protein SAMN04487963_2306 [Marinobacter zhejiangensis]